MWLFVSHDPPGSCDTSWRMTAGMSRSVSLFSSGLPWWILMASLVLLLDTWSSLSNILASFRLHLWPVLSRCSSTAVLGCRPVVCSLYLVCSLASAYISPMYICHSCHISIGIPPPIVVPWVFCPLIGFTSISLLFVELWHADTPCFLKFPEAVLMDLVCMECCSCVLCLFLADIQVFFFFALFFFLFDDIFMAQFL